MQTIVTKADWDAITEENNSEGSKTLFVCVTSEKDEGVEKLKSILNSAVESLQKDVVIRLVGDEAENEVKAALLSLMESGTSGSVILVLKGGKKVESVEITLETFSADCFVALVQKHQ